jgi:hypothetical protein
MESVRKLYQQSWVPLPDRIVLAANTERKPPIMTKLAGWPPVLRFASAGEEITPGLRVARQRISNTETVEHLVRIPIVDRLASPCPVRRCHYWFYSEEQFENHLAIAHQMLTKETYAEKTNEELYEAEELDFDRVLSGGSE